MLFVGRIENVGEANASIQMEIRDTDVFKFSFTSKQYEQPS
jgi:hypothetical protein